MSEEGRREPWRGTGVNFAHLQLGLMLSPRIRSARDRALGCVELRAGGPFLSSEELCCSAVVDYATTTQGEHLGPTSDRKIHGRDQFSRAAAIVESGALAFLERVRSGVCLGGPTWRAPSLAKFIAPGCREAAGTGYAALDGGETR
jgi:hypothetical protein